LQTDRPACLPAGQHSGGTGQTAPEFTRHTRRDWKRIYMAHPSPGSDPVNDSMRLAVPCPDLEVRRFVSRCSAGTAFPVSFRGTGSVWCFRSQRQCGKGEVRQNALVCRSAAAAAGRGKCNGEMAINNASSVSLNSYHSDRGTMGTAGERSARIT
jgi:hypothetical protein